MNKIYIFILLLITIIIIKQFYCRFKNDIEKYEINKRILLTDLVFPSKFAKWRLV